MNFIDAVKAIYTKSRFNFSEADDGLCIGISKYLSRDSDNLEAIKEAINYLFYIAPENYLRLLYLTVPKKFRVPFLKKSKAEELEDSDLWLRLKEILNWSTREMKFNRIAINKILSNEQHWKQELGVK